MEISVRSQRNMQLQDQENSKIIGKKNNLVLPTKRQGLTVRGVLGELTNVDIRREIGKVVGAAAENEKKASRGVPKSTTYNHVQSKVNTGLAAKPGAATKPPTKPILKREESTRGLALRAVARAVVKDQNKQTEGKKPANASLVQANKVTKTRIPALKENVKGKTSVNESTESLEKLKLVENDEEAAAQLPNDIEDIDTDNSPFLVSIYIKDVYRYLRILEEKYPIEANYLSVQKEVTGSMRALLIDWLVDVYKQFSLLLETFQITVGIIDRYLQANPNVQRNELQLVGITAMFIAAKYEEVYIPEAGDFIFVTDNAYTRNDLFRCEKQIMRTLNFSFSKPIPLSFLRRFVKVTRASSREYHLSKYLVDLSLVEYGMAHYRPSELAAAAVCCARHLLSGEPLAKVWSRDAAYYSQYQLEHLKPIIAQMARTVLAVDTCKWQAVRTLYAASALAKVACLPQLRGETIQKLAKMDREK